MDKNLKTILKILLCTFIFNYMCFSFILWDLYPVNWEQKERVLYIIFSIVLSLMQYMHIIISKEIESF